MSVIETPRRFSQSLFWHFQGEYYKKNGRAAWSSGEVPFRMSSNPFIANSYAEIIRGYLRDLAAQSDGVPIDQKRIVILELGAGSGRFGYLLLSALLKLTDGLVPERLPKFQYLMTDLAQSNVDGWLEHPKFKPLFDQGVLEFATLDVGNPLEAQAQVSNQSLEAFIDGAPVVVVANYLLDVLVHDAFRVEDKELYEMQVGIESKGAEQETIGTHDHFKKIEMRETPVFASLPYYEEPEFNAILEDYRQNLAAATFLFPIVALRGLNKLRQISGGRMLLLVSDMALRNTAQLEGKNSLGLALNGSYSTTLNLDAFIRWAQHSSGQVLVTQTHFRKFDTYGFLLGHSKPCAETEIAYRQHADRFGAKAYYDLISNANTRKELLTPAALLGLLQLSHFDPQVVWRLKRPLLDAANVANTEERAALVLALEKCWENHFSIGEERNPAFTIGRTMARLRQNTKALVYYQHAIDEFGPNWATYRNMGKCWEKLGDPSKALNFYRQSLNQKQTPYVEQAVERLEGQQA